MPPHNYVAHMGFNLCTRSNNPPVSFQPPISSPTRLPTSPPTNMVLQEMPPRDHPSTTEFTLLYNQPTHPPQPTTTTTTPTTPFLPHLTSETQINAFARLVLEPLLPSTRLTVIRSIFLARCHDEVAFGKIVARTARVSATVAATVHEALVQASREQTRAVVEEIGDLARGLEGMCLDWVDGGGLGLEADGGGEMKRDEELVGELSRLSLQGKGSDGLSVAQRREWDEAVGRMVEILERHV